MTSLIRRFRLSAVLACATAVFGVAAASDAWAQNGLIAEYYNTNNHTGNRAIAIQTNVGPLDNATVYGGVPIAGVNADNWSVRYRGKITIATTEDVTFYTIQDDQSRLYIDGNLVLTNTAVGTEASVVMTGLTAGQHDFMLEFIEFTGNAYIGLRWSSPTIPKAIIPVTAFTSPNPVTTPAAPIATPNGGVTPQSVTLSTTTVGADIYYTTDGTDPGSINPQTNPSATKYTVPINVNSYLRIRARAYLPVPPDRMAISSDMLTTADFSPNFAAITPPAGTVAGLYLRDYANASGATLPTFSTLIPRQRAIVPQPLCSNPPVAPFPARPNNDNTNFAYFFTGYLNIPTGGMWTFWLTSDDQARYYVDGQLVINNTGATVNTSAVSLSAGFHSINISLAQGGGNSNLNLEWQGPAGNNPARQQVPVAAYTTEPMPATPVIAPAGGGFNGSQVVTLTCATPNAVIFYTIDGSNPDPRQAGGSGPSGTTLTLTTGAVVKALASAPGMNPSIIASATFTAPPKPTVATAAQVATEVVVQFDKPLMDASIAPANFTITPPIAVSAAVPLTKPGMLAAYYKMDDTTGFDSSGNNNTATVTNGTTDAANKGFAALINPAGANPASVAFTATTTFVAPDSASLNVGQGSFTASAWIRTTNFTVTQRIMNKWDNATSVGWIFDVNANGFLRFRMRDPNGRNYDVAAPNATVTANGTWYHVAVRVDKLTEQVTYFTNGVPVYGPINADVNMDTLTNTTQFGVGQIPSTAGSPFLGNIDDVRLYKTALTNNEIQALFGASDHLYTAVKLTTATLAQNTTYTLNVLNVQDHLGNTINPAATVPFRYFPTGTVSFERFDGITGGAITDIARNAAYPSATSSGAFPTMIETPTNAADNYGGRVRGYIIPTATNNYQFAIATDDGGKFFLSTDEDPSNKVQISRCNVWAPVRTYTDPDILQSGSINLTAGKKYYFEAYFKEGGGGDNLAVAAKVFDGTAIADATVPIGDPASVFPAGSIAPYVEAMNVTANVSSVSVGAGRAITLSVPFVGTYMGATPTHYQWQKNGANIVLNANGPTYTIAAATAADAGSYTLILANTINTITSPPHRAQRRQRPREQRDPGRRAARGRHVRDDHRHGVPAGHDRHVRRHAGHGHHGAERIDPHGHHARPHRGPLGRHGHHAQPGGKHGRGLHVL